ncbi:MAG: cobyrinate a,c-diamide synthase [Pseudomonadota bacterium]
MNTQQQQALMVAAPQSGSGKTVITLALLRALKDIGLDISAAKAGPDYIDPGFHAIASGRPSVNLDPWAMRTERLEDLAAAQAGSYLMVEAMMGLYDGAADGSASPASLAKSLGMPILFVIDAARQSHSIAALMRGFRDHDHGLNFAGIILNRVGSARHETLLRNALADIEVPVLGAVPCDQKLGLPERHLGLVQAGETSEIENFIGAAGQLIATHCDLELIKDSFKPTKTDEKSVGRLPPLGQRIAIAQDNAFSFIYPHHVNDWREQGAELSFFSPLKDEAPNRDSDAIFLPGGYPELHGEALSEASGFKKSMLDHRHKGTLIYGECGGYMTLGEGLIDADGNRHAMLGLLQLETSFEKRKLHLGYRQLKTNDFGLGERLRGHEFHYSSALKAQGKPLFDVKDALGADLGTAGLRSDNVMGSYMHIIDRV